MTFRSACTTALLVLVSAGRPLLAQEADQPAVAPTEQKPTPEASRFEAVLDLSAAASSLLISDLAFSPDGRMLLSTSTYGNPLGVEVAPVEAALRAQLGIEENSGVVVTSVAPDSAAAQGGLQAHDLVLTINGEAIAGTEKFHEIIVTEQGKPVSLGLVRQGLPRTLEITLAATPVYELVTSNLLLFDAADSRYRIGVTLSEADDTLRSQLRLAAGEGLVVTDVVADSPAAGAGIKPHDVLVKLDGKRLSSVENINAQIQEVADRTVTLAYVRGGQELACEITPQLSHEGVSQHANLNLTSDGVRIWSTIDGSANHAIVRWLTVGEGLPNAVAHSAPPVDPAATLTDLKRQLAEMQKSLQALEAALQPAPQAAPPADTPPQE
jgi:membrane-associated protease RseP (regulator of RpoE activity)